jgi:hypothetical protein
MWIVLKNNMEVFLMLKKTIGTAVTVAAIFAGLGSTATEASQWNNSSMQQYQSNSGWTKIYQEQRKSASGSAFEFNGARGAAQGQAAFVNGYQVQSGQSESYATASQSEDTTIDVGDVQGGNATVTTGSGNTSQTTSVSGPAHVLQSQTTTNAVFHFQGSIEGGPTIQNQMSQTHTSQFSAVVSH